MRAHVSALCAKGDKAEGLLVALYCRWAQTFVAWALSFIPNNSSTV